MGQNNFRKICLRGLPAGSRDNRTSGDRTNGARLGYLKVTCCINTATPFHRPETKFHIRSTP